MKASLTTSVDALELRRRMLRLKDQSEARRVRTCRLIERSHALIARSRRLIRLMQDQERA
jgi:hypothetical protein